MNTYIDVTISATVWSAEHLIRAAREAAIAAGDYTSADAEAAFNEDSLDDCARYLLDPGKSPPGLEITDVRVDEVNVDGFPS